MTGKRLLLHSIFLLLLPVIVAWYGISVAGAIALVVLALLWRWAITLSGLIAPAKVPPLELETISASHFVEKVRWCMDRLGVEYVEKPVGGTLGVFFLGRTVPRLWVTTGLVRSSIGNSPDILRYLWGRYSATAGDRATFLEPTPDRLEMEKKIDRCGFYLQVWVYYHTLDDKKLIQHAWGCDSPSIPLWQRWTIRILFPLLRVLMRRVFRISDAACEKAVAGIETLLTEVEALLTDGRSSLLGGNDANYVDITFAAISGLWLQPKGYGAGKADHVRLEREQVPAKMRQEIEGWIERYPLAVDFIQRLYREERVVAQ